MDHERMDEKDWDDVADSFEEEIFNVPANDRKGLIKERIFRFGGKHQVAADSRLRRGPHTSLAC
ncbi:MAG: hypothetical protein QM724_03380 [Flavobacteriales bacterium]